MAETRKRWWRRRDRIRLHRAWLKPLPQGPVVFNHSLCVVVAGQAMQEATDERRIPEPRRAA